MKAPDSTGSDRDRTTFVTSLAIVLLGLSVLVGWSAHVPFAIHVIDGLPPMQFNTALCFLALGVAGIGLALGRRRVLLCGGIVAALMGLAVMLEYATGTSFGIDTLFFYPWERTQSVHAGRMALTTAIGFFLTGSALAMVAVRPRACAILGIANSLTLSLALTSLIAYGFQLSGVPPFDFRSQMALHTSVAFLAHGIAMLGYAWRHAGRGANGLPAWLTGIGVALLPVLLLGGNALFPDQSWRIVAVEALFGLVGLALIALAIRGLTTAKVAYKGLLMITIPLILLLTFVGLMIHVKHQGKSALELALHSTEVIGVSRSLLAQIAEVESGVRDYRLTRDDAFARSYAAAQKSVKLAAIRLRWLVKDNPRQETIAGRIEVLTAQRMDHLSGVVRAIGMDDRKQIEELIKGRKGVDLMEQLRAATAVFLSEEDRLGAQRRLDLDASSQRLNGLLVAGIAAAILLASILTISFTGGISKRLRLLRNNAISLAAGKELAPPLTGHDEIAELDRAFHAMAESLGEAARREKANRQLEVRTIDVRHSEALLKTGALQSAIFNSANFSSIATDAKGVIQIFNVGAERMLGYTAAEVVNTITPAEISDSQEVIARAKALSVELDTPITPGFEALVFKASRGIEDIYELTYIRKDGSRFPAVVSVTALRDPQDAIIGYLLIGTDNTARKRAEAALVKAGALQSAIFNSANFSSIATDAKGVIQIFNVGAERMLGYAAADVVNRITPAHISDPQEVIARAKELSLELSTTITPGFEALVFKASRGIEDIYELTYIRKDGTRLPAVVSVTALRDVDSGIIGYLLIGTDNTARKQVEEERKKLDQRLRDQQFYTRSLIEANIDAIMTTDPLGIITDVNQQMEALTGSTRDELIGAPFKNYFTDPEQAETAIKLMLREKKVTNYELTARARDGKETVVSYNATTFYDRDRKLQGVFAAARDVTERKHFEQALQKSNVELESAMVGAEKANRAKSDFLSSMSHELRSPLNAILGFAQLMESSSPSPTTVQAARITQILQAGWHLLALINEILDLAVIESGQVSLSTESVSLSEIVSDCQAMMEPLAQQRGIQMRFPRFNHPIFVRADMTRLKQVVINLLSNAIKYNKEQGMVFVDCAAIEPERIRISVRDTGTGLSPEKLSQLFQPFNRLGQEAGGVTGTGIGLVVTKRLVELMGGAIGVESTPGIGSVFWVDLSSTEAPELNGDEPASAVPAQPRQPAGPRTFTLLYIEDNPANMMLVEQLIARRSDIRLLTAVSGTLGIELARVSGPDIILMDINLPGLSGFDVLKILRDGPATAHIPIVALSANAMPRDIEMGIEAGFFRYLTKPIKIKEFMETLDAALEFSKNGPVTHESLTTP